MKGGENSTISNVWFFFFHLWRFYSRQRQRQRQRHVSVFFWSFCHPSEKGGGKGVPRFFFLSLTLTGFYFCKQGVQKEIRLACPGGNGEGRGKGVCLVVVDID